MFSIKESIQTKLWTDFDHFLKIVLASPLMAEKLVDLRSSLSQNKYWHSGSMDCLDFQTVVATMEAKDT